MEKRNKSEGASVRVFLSYSTGDKKTAGMIKEELEKFGLEVFLAHEDIEPSEEWQNAILNGLKGCDVFIPLLTKKFKTSDWTDQETGIAFFNKKMIIPLEINILPYGFIGKYQALKIDRDDIRYKKIRSGCIEIFKTILRNSPEEFKNKMFNSLIKKFANSPNFAVASSSSELLLEISESKRRINEIADAAIKNDQIYKCSSAQGNLRRLFSDNKDKIDPRFLPEIKKLYSL